MTSLRPRIRSLRLFCWAAILIPFSFCAAQEREALPRITVNVQDADGKPVPGVWVKAVRPRGVGPRPRASRYHEGYTQLDGKGVVTSPLGVVEVVARDPISRKLVRSDRLEINADSQETIRLVVSTEGLASLSGRITVDGKAPAQVWFVPEQRSRSGRFGWRSLHRVPVADSGAFAARLLPGNYRVVAKRLHTDPCGYIGLACVSPVGKSGVPFVRAVETVQVQFEYSEKEPRDDKFDLFPNKIELRDSLHLAPFHHVGKKVDVCVIRGRYRLELGTFPSFTRGLPWDSNIADVAIRRPTTIRLGDPDRVRMKLWDGYEPYVVTDPSGMVSWVNDRSVDPPRFVDERGIGRSVRLVPSAPSDYSSSQTIDAIELPTGVPGEIFCEHNDVYFRGRWSGRAEEDVEWTQLSDRRGYLIVRDVPKGADRFELERVGGSPLEKHYLNRFERPIHDGPGGSWDVRVPHGEYRVVFFSSDKGVESRSMQTEVLDLSAWLTRHLFVPDDTSAESFAHLYARPLSLGGERASLRDYDSIQLPRDAPGTLIVSSEDQFFFRRIDPGVSKPAQWTVEASGKLTLNGVTRTTKLQLRPFPEEALKAAIAEEWGPFYTDQDTRYFIVLPGRYSLYRNENFVAHVDIHARQSTTFQLSSD